MEISRERKVCSNSLISPELCLAQNFHSPVEGIVLGCCWRDSLRRMEKSARPDEQVDVLGDALTAVMDRLLQEPERRMLAELWAAS